MLVAVLLLFDAPVFPAFFLGTLAVLLLVSRPSTAREWLWMAVLTGALIAWFQLPDTLSQQAVRAAAIFFTGAFVALTLAGVRTLSGRALLAASIAAICLAGWFAAFHLHYTDLQHDFTAQSWAAARVWMPELPVSPPVASLDALAAPGVDRAHSLAAAVSTAATFYGALLAMAAMLASWLAWVWYQRIAHAPVGPPSKPFRDFRFNDQLVWALVATIAVLLVGGASPVHVAADNVLLVVLGLYWVRGLAVMTTALRRASPIVIGIVILIMLPMVAFVLVGFTLLGVADTWLDFRRRMAPPTGVPS